MIGRQQYPFLRSAKKPEGQIMHQKEASWRQGSLITQESSRKLGLFEKDSLDKYIIIISHDCDLLNDNEDNVEVIISNIVTKADPAYAKARHVRRSHLSYKVVLLIKSYQLNCTIRHVVSSL